MMIRNAKKLPRAFFLIMHLGCSYNCKSIEVLIAFLSYFISYLMLDIRWWVRNWIVSVKFWLFQKKKLEQFYNKRILWSTYNLRRLFGLISFLADDIKNLLIVEGTGDISLTEPADIGLAHSSARLLKFRQRNMQVGYLETETIYIETKNSENTVKQY